MQFFGHQMLILWKFALLGKRILFFSPPPIGDVCYRGERLSSSVLVFVLFSYAVLWIYWKVFVYISSSMYLTGSLESTNVCRDFLFPNPKRDAPATDS